MTSAMTNEHQTPTPKSREEQRQRRSLNFLAAMHEREDRAHEITGGRRCGIMQSAALKGWWVGFSPRNGPESVCEGPWEDMVVLAREILAYDEEIKAGRATAHISPWGDEEDDG